MNKVAFVLRHPALSGGPPMSTVRLSDHQKTALGAAIGLGIGDWVDHNGIAGEVVDLHLESTGLQASPRVMLSIDTGDRDEEDRAGVIRYVEVLGVSTPALHRL